MTMTSQFSHMTSSSIFLMFFFFVSLVKFNYWSKFHANIITGSGVTTIFSFIRDWPEILKLEKPSSEFCPISREWDKLGIPNQARMSLMKFYWMLQNTRVTVFTVSELLRENRKGETSSVHHFQGLSVVKNCLRPEDASLTLPVLILNEEKKLNEIFISTLHCGIGLQNFQYFCRPLYNPVKHLWWSFYCKNSKPLSIFWKELHRRWLLEFWIRLCFLETLRKSFISINYFTL